MKLLKFISRVGVVTPLQIAQFNFQGGEMLARDSLEQMRLQLSWLGRLKDIDVPKKYGGGIITVYYLTAKGGEAACQFAEILTNDLVAVGKPCGNRLRTIYHDLYINKALLWLEQRVVIHKYQWEKILRRNQFNKRKIDNKLSNENSMNYSMGDFRIQYERLGEPGNTKWMECEVSTSLDAEQIRSKPDDMFWFVVGEATADLVEETKASKAKYIVQLGKLNSSLYPKAEIEKQQKASQSRLKEKDDSDFKLSYQRVLYGLKVLGGVGTASAIAAFLKLDRTAASRTLSSMEAEGLLFSQGVQMTPGKEVGARKKLFVAATQKQLSLAQRKYRLIVSEWIQNLSEYNYLLKTYDHETKSLFLYNDRDIDSSRLVIVVDDLEIDTEEIADIYFNVKKDWASYTISLAVWSQRRKSELEKISQSIEFSVLPNVKMS